MARWPAWRGSKAEFSYFGIADTDEAPAWHPDWKDQKTLPELVRLSVTFADGDEGAWPDLVVAPQISATTAPSSSRRRRRGR